MAHSTATFVPFWPWLDKRSMRSLRTSRIAFRNSMREFVRCCRTAGEIPKTLLYGVYDFATRAGFVNDLFARRDWLCSVLAHGASFISTVRTLLLQFRPGGRQRRHRARQADVAPEGTDLDHQFVALLEQPDLALGGEWQQDAEPRTGRSASRMCTASLSGSRRPDPPPQHTALAQAPPAAACPAPRA